MSDSQHILILRFSALGDVAMTLPVIRVVVQTYPNLKLTICSKPFFRPLFQDIPNCSFLESDLYGEHKNLGLQKLAD
ncbi:MAG: ADP-heptose--LPS heptosyltransferase RfaF, partial [Flavobacteriaceae bacterium]|nr:ADP-heptose--LPS heptosyltransferase RfaF [Flavobacteriaceae bacterium]